MHKTRWQQLCVSPIKTCLPAVSVLPESQPKATAQPWQLCITAAERQLILLSNETVSLAGQNMYRASSSWRLALKETLELSVPAWSSLGSTTGLSYLACLVLWCTRCLIRHAAQSAQPNWKGTSASLRSLAETAELSCIPLRQLPLGQICPRVTRQGSTRCRSLLTLP